MNRRDLLIAPAALAFAAGADAQIDSAPVRILVGAPAGGPTHTLAPPLAGPPGGGSPDPPARGWPASLGPGGGRAVIVENKPGAGGNIAAEAIARAAPDGRMLLMSFTSHAINATLYPTLPFDPVKDFTALTCVPTSPSILVAHPSVPAKDMRELIALAKARPGQLNIAIGALGSSLHMAGEAFKMQSGVDIVNIPYQGT